MNILFRKNFQAEGSSKERSYSSGLGRRTTSGNTNALGTVRRTRESRLAAVDRNRWGLVFSCVEPLDRRYNTRTFY